MDIDTYNEWNPGNPINQEELPELTELEQLEDYNQDLVNKNARLRLELRKLKEIEESFKTFGFLSYEETTEKNNILNKY